MTTAQLDFAPTPATVTAAIERIVAACQPSAILAFGSRARGDARPDSDLDLLVLLPAPVADRWALSSRLQSLLSGLLFSRDVLISDLETFAHKSQQLNSVYQCIAEEGFLLWREGMLDPAAVKMVCG